MVVSMSQIFILCSLANVFNIVASSPEAGRLFEALLENYNKLSRPVEQPVDELVFIQFKLKLLQILDVEEKDQVLTINGWLVHIWHDYRLKWSPSDYNNLTLMHIPAQMLWLPDIILYNNADESPHVTKMTKARVYSNGRIEWVPPVIYKSVCAISIKYFPFDEQLCEMKFGTWSYYSTEVIINHLERDVEIESIDAENKSMEWTVELGVDLSQYQESVEWDLMSARSIRHNKSYDCCPQTTLDITYYLNIRRKTLFYAINLITPIVGITMLTCLVFYLPSDSNNKITLSVSVLVTLTVFLLLLVEIIPPTSTAIPLIARYLLFTMILVTISLVITVAVLNIHYRSVLAQPMPAWARKAFMEWVPQLLAMRRPVKVELPPFDSDEAEECNTFANEQGVRSVSEMCPRASLASRSPASTAKQHAARSAARNGTLRVATNRVCRNVFYIARHLQIVQFENEIRDDWRFVAMVIDRIFLLIFTLAVLVGTGTIIMSAPYFRDGRLPLKTGDENASGNSTFNIFTY